MASSSKSEEASAPPLADAPMSAPPGAFAGAGEGAPMMAPPSYDETMKQPGEESLQWQTRNYSTTVVDRLCRLFLRSHPTLSSSSAAAAHVAPAGGRPSATTGPAAGELSKLCMR